MISNEIILFANKTTDFLGVVELRDSYNRKIHNLDGYIVSAFIRNSYDRSKVISLITSIDNGNLSLYLPFMNVSELREGIWELYCDLYCQWNQKKIRIVTGRVIVST